MKSIRLLILPLYFLFVGYGCSSDGQIEKNHKQRSNTVYYKDSIHDIKTDLIFGDSWVYVIDNYLVLCETSPQKERGIHLFNKNTFQYLTSTGIVGKGPGEVARQGNIGINRKSRVLWVSDFGKMALWKFPLDSILSNRMYKPTEKLSLNTKLFINSYGFLSDSVVLGNGVGVISNSSFAMHTVKLNLNTNVTIPYGYEHPEAQGRRKSSSFFALSVEHNFYVNTYYYLDLITICDLQGNLKFNVYGPGWKNREHDKNNYFYGVDLFKGQIIASYIADIGLVYDEFKREVGNLPSKLIILDKDGEYLKTIELGYKFKFFCVDEENARVIFYFDDRENPLGYINLHLPKS